MEKGSGSGLPNQSHRSKPSSVDFSGGRLRFKVELNPGETKIVSWKHLMKEANLTKANRNLSWCPSSGDQHTFESFDSRSAPPPPSSVESSFGNQMKQTDSKDLQAQAGSSRLSAVIEKIERMYAGNGSSDEENLALDNVPDDDEYDTEDSFINDSELDEYFKVDDSAIKYDGFFVHRGKLEFNEPIISTDQQPKKRGHTDLTEGSGSDGHNPHKIVKKESEDEKVSSVQKSSANLPDIEATLNVQMKSEDPMPTVGNEGSSVEVEKIKTEHVSVPSS